MSLVWENCRIVFCLFFLNPATFTCYLESTVTESFQITNELVRKKLYPRWKIRLYVGREVYSRHQYVEALQLIHKNDVEIIPMDLPNKNCHPYWYTSMRFILPSQDRSLNAFRLLDVHYYWTMRDVTHAIEALETWEASNKRCCLWEYVQKGNRPYCAAVFGLNLSKDTNDDDFKIDFNFIFYILKQSRENVTNDRSRIKYGDDEYLIGKMVDYYFLDSMGNIDGNKVFLNSTRETYYITNSKRWNGVGADPLKYINRFRIITDVFSCNMPHRVSNDQKIVILYK